MRVVCVSLLDLMCVLGVGVLERTAQRCVCQSETKGLSVCECLEVE